MSQITAIKLNRPLVFATVDQRGNYEAGAVLRVPEDVPLSVAEPLLGPSHAGQVEAHAVLADRNVADAVRRGVAVKKPVVVLSPTPTEE